MNEIVDIARDNNLILIEDVAQALNGKYNGRMLGSFGDFAMFSFRFTKDITSFRGGALLTNEKINMDLKSDSSFKAFFRLFITLAAMKQIKMTPAMVYVCLKKHILFPFFKESTSKFDTSDKMLSNYQCYLLYQQLKKLSIIIEKRRANAKYYSKELRGVVFIPEETKFGEHTYYRYTIQSDKRDELYNYLLKHGIEADKMYDYCLAALPNSIIASKSNLNIPVHHELTKEDLEKVVGTIHEYKSSLSEWKEIVKTISAFANTKGGVIIVGVDSSNNILGVQIGKKTIEDLAKRIKEYTDPKSYPSISVSVDEVDVKKKIIVIKVKESKSKPVFAFDRVYKRVGKSNHRVSSDEIRKMALEAKKIYWDEEICEGANLEDIEEEKVKWYLERREEIRKVKKPEKMEMEILLLNTGAAKKVNSEIKPTNAGILFFGKNPQRFVLQSQLRTARFAGKTMTRDFLDRLDCSGALWEMVEESEDFIRKNIRLFGFRTEYSFQRIDKLEYPIKALREAIINALIHRNYFEPADTRVAIFDDRIEIISPGSFPKGVTPHDQ